MKGAKGSVAVDKCAALQASAMSGTARGGDLAKLKIILTSEFKKLLPLVQVQPPQPTMRTDLDIGARNPVITTVTGFFLALFEVETQ